MDDAVVKDHQVRGSGVLPGVAYLELAQQRSTQAHTFGLREFTDVLWVAPFAMEAGAKSAWICLTPKERAFQYEVRSGDGRATLHARGTVRPLTPGVGDTIERVPIREVEQRCSEELTSDALYRRFTSLGMSYGKSFQTVASIRFNGREAIARVAMSSSDSTAGSEWALPAGLLDGALQAMGPLLDSAGGLSMPYSIERVEHLLVSVERNVHATTNGGGRVDVSVASPDGQLCLRMHGVSLRPTKESAPLAFFAPAWRVTELDPAPPRARENGGVVLIIHTPDKPDLAKALASAHAGDTVRSIVLAPGDPASLIDALHDVDRIDTVYFLGGLSERPVDPCDVMALADSQQLGVFSLLRLVKALGRRGLTMQPARLIVVVNDVYGIDGSDPANPCAASPTGDEMHRPREPGWRHVYRGREPELDGRRAMRVGSGMARPVVEVVAGEKVRAGVGRKGRAGLSACASPGQVAGRRLVAF